MEDVLRRKPDRRRKHTGRSTRLTPPRPRHALRGHAQEHQPHLPADFHRCALQGRVCEALRPETDSLRGLALDETTGSFWERSRRPHHEPFLRSFVASCELIKLDPFRVVRYVLSRITSHSIQQLEELLPHRAASQPLVLPPPQLPFCCRPPRDAYHNGPVWFRLRRVI
jgi:hypothetical protein